MYFAFVVESGFGCPVTGLLRESNEGRAVNASPVQGADPIRTIVTFATENGTAFTVNKVTCLYADTI